MSANGTYFGTVTEYLEVHRRWLLDFEESESQGKRHATPPPSAEGMWFDFEDLSGKDLRRADLHGTVWRSAKLAGANLSGANLHRAALSDGDLSDANLTGANLKCASLKGANLQDADLAYTNLEQADLEGADLANADLQHANFSYAGMSGANLAGAYLYGTVLEFATLSGAKGLPSAADCLKEWYEWTDEGVRAYKATPLYHPAPPHWVWEPGAILRECGVHNRTVECGTGVNLSTREGVKEALVGRYGRREPYVHVWEVLIPFHSLPGVVVPYVSTRHIRVVDADVVLVREIVGEELDEMWKRCPS